MRDAEILKLVEKTLDRKNPRDWYYALMDYGAHLARSGKENPNRRSRHYARQPEFEGSNRQVRARILRLMLKDRFLTGREIAGRLSEPPGRIAKILAALEKEGIIKESKSAFTIA